MSHKVVPTKSEVRGQAACPYQATLLSVVWTREGHGQVFGKQLFSSKMAYGTSHCHVAISREHNLEGGALKEASPPALEPGGEGLGLSGL